MMGGDRNSSEITRNTPTTSTNIHTVKPPLHDNTSKYQEVVDNLKQAEENQQTSSSIPIEDPETAVPRPMPQSQDGEDRNNRGAGVAGADNNSSSSKLDLGVGQETSISPSKNYLYNSSIEDRPNEKNTSPLSGILSLTKKQKKPHPPKIHATGIVNYGIRGGYSDSESDASSMVSVDSSPQGYAMPSAMNFSNSRSTPVDLIEDFDDDASARTPIPKAPPQPTLGAVLPSSFLRDRSNSISNVSDLSEEESSVIKRKKREEENVGRLVQAAKQQQSFAQAWFSAGQSATNALPKYVPPKNKIPSNAPPNLQKKKTSFKIPEKESRSTSGESASYKGPIDLDSGDVWDGDEEDSKANLEIGSFHFTTHSGTTKKRTNKGFIQFGVPDDEDLTTYYQENKCLDRVVCTLGNTKCSLLALLVVSIGIIIIIVGSTVAGVYINKSTIEKSSAPSVSMSPSMSPMPSAIPSYSPTFLPSASPSESPTAEPTASPSNKPSPSPTPQPSPMPSSSPTSQPTSSPTSQPTSQPTTMPSISIQPTSSPSSSPSSFFSASFFEQVGPDLDIRNKGQTDKFGQSVSISKDGSIMAVGALSYPNGFGSVIVYRRGVGEVNRSTGNPWSEMGNSIEGRVPNSGAGHAVKVTEDGLTLIMGEHRYGNTQIPMSGVARVFRFNSATQIWDQIGSDLEGSWSGGEFGYSVAIASDGNKVAIGARNHNRATGQVVVYTLNTDNGETEWQQTGPAINGNGVGDMFGHDVSLSKDGNIVACGAPQGTPNDSGAKTGVVKVYKWNPNNFRWEQYGNDVSLTAFALIRFGWSISLSSDGSRIAASAPYNNVVNSEGFFFRSGTVSIFQFGNSEFGGPKIADRWFKIGDDIIGEPAISQEFGYSTSMAAGGRHIAIGSPLKAPPLDPLNQVGQVTLYRWNGLIWDVADPIDGTSVNEAFGFDVDIQIDDDNDLSFIATGGPGLPFTTNQGVARVYEWKHPRG